MANRYALFALKKLYGLWLGELERIEHPPKTMMRASRGRKAFLEREPERRARAEEIRLGLPQIAYVIGLFEPDWRPEDARVIRPKAPRGADIPPQGWVAEALDVLREADEFMTIADIVREIANEHSLDHSQLVDRQRAHNAVNNALMITYKEMLVRDDGEPARWALRSRRLTP